MTHRKLKRPKSYASNERLFENEATKKKWRVRTEFRDPTPGEEGPNDLSVCVSVTPEGDPSATPTTHTHTFTEVELAAPDFDPEARLASIIAVKLADAEKVEESKKRLSDLRARWERDQD